jgi:hypothetical protein
VKRTRRDESIRFATCLCIETTEGNSLCGYLYLKLAKMPIFSFYLLCFFSTKLESRREEQLLAGRVALALLGKGQWRGNR